MSRILIHVFFIIFLTSLTGSLMQCVWYMVKKVYGNKNPLAVYTGLKLVCISYIVPVVYMISLNYFYNSFFCIDKKRNIIRLLEFTPLVMNVLLVLGIMWVCLFLYILSYRISQYLKWKSYIKSKYEETDEKILEKNEECRRRLHIKKVPKIYRKIGLSTPLCTGVFDKIILLPDKGYRDNLEVIFMHELTHIKKHDLELKWLSVVITIIYCFNPMVFKLFREISVWSEIRCDIYACKQGEGMFTIKNYYNVILNIMLENKNKKIKDFIITALTEKSSDIKVRIQHIKNYKKTKKGIRILASGVMMTTMLGSICISYITATVCLNRYDRFVRNNFPIEVETMLYQDEFLQNNDEIKNMKIEALQEERRYEGIVKSDVLYKIQKIYCKSENKITISYKVLEDADKYIAAGIIGEDGIIKGVKNKSIIVHTFDIEKDGEYDIFIENLNDIDIKVKGTYYVE